MSSKQLAHAQTLAPHISSPTPARSESIAQSQKKPLHTTRCGPQTKTSPKIQTNKRIRNATATVSSFKEIMAPNTSPRYNLKWGMGEGTAAIFHT